MGDAVTVLPPDCRIVGFADAPELTANALHPQSDDEPLAQTMKRQMCRDDHESAARAAVRDGIITPLNPHSYVPVPDWEHAQLDASGHDARRLRAVRGDGIGPRGVWPRAET